MERLTMKTEDGYERVSVRTKNQQLIDKLGRYEDLDEQDRMIIFPCSKGDKIYEFYLECAENRLEAGETPKDIISMRRVCYFEYDGDETYIYASQALPVRLFNNDGPFCIPVSEIGKTVFLSYEEAEAKLKELRGGIDDNHTCNCQHNSKDNELYCKCDSRQTNASRIRSMSDEELAEFLCKVKSDYQWMEHEFPSEEEHDEWEEWLQSEVE